MSTEPGHLPTYPDLANKVAVVTDGSREIGAATARAFAANGVRVTVNGREQAAIDNTVDQIRSRGGQAVGVAPTAPFSPTSSACAVRSGRRLGPVDILAAFVATGHAGLGGSFLASDNSAWITGVTLDVAGGRIVL